MKESNRLLDRINNLISADSSVLTGYNNSIEMASSSKVKAETEKKSYESDIKNIQTDIDNISKLSELKDRFANLDVYKSGLEKLGDARDYIDKLNDELGRIPEHIEGLENKIKDLDTKSSKCEKTIEESDDELSKLDVELSDAKRYQSNLVDLINLAKSGDINKTREEVIETLTHVGFNDHDAMNAAKVILFPEDELIPFFKDDNKKGTKKNDEEIVEPEEEKEDNDLEIISPVTKDKIRLEAADENEVETSEDNPKEEIEKVDESKNDAKVKEVLSNNGLDIAEFDKDTIDLLNNVLDDTIIKNIDFLLSKNISKDFIYKYPNVLSDTELESKYDFIIKELDKTEDDIKINPVILISYSLNDYKKLANIANKSGINFKNIPIYIFIKGLQTYLQNYLSLTNVNINLDENELSKFSAVLDINQIDFKASLTTILSYNLTLKKMSGKYAIMALLKKADTLMAEINELIEIGEEDILKYYPEVLEGNVHDLVSRIEFVKKTGIPYKVNAHGETVYQSYIFSQEKLEKVLDQKVDLHSSKVLANDILKSKLKDPSYLDELNDLSADDRLLSLNMDTYEKVLNKYNKVIKDSDNTFVIDDMYFAKNRVKENLNYLLTNVDNLNTDDVLLTSLVFNTYLDEEHINDLIKLLGLKVGK